MRILRLTIVFLALEVLTAFSDDTGLKYETFGWKTHFGGGRIVWKFNNGLYGHMILMRSI